MSVVFNQLEDKIEQIKEEVVKWRRYLHQHPELSFEEERTAQFVYDTLSSFGNLELSRPTKTSVVARLHGGQPGGALAIRADMDALPIAEENDFAFKSQNNGVMHACGHDGHTAMLLGTAKILSELQSEVPGEIRFLFQHAEELFPGGAEELVQAGVLDGVSQVIGIHLWAPLEVGKIGIRAGAMMAAPDSFNIVVHGKGGHAAQPHLTIDSIAIGAQVVTNLQHIVSRNVDPLDPLVLSITKFHAGTAHNVIPGTVEMAGTVRSFKPELRDDVPHLMERIIKGITAAHGASYEFEYVKGYRPVINDEEVAVKLRESLVRAFGEGVVEDAVQTMGGEDFSAYQTAAKGTFFFVGAGNQAKNIVYPHHHPRFTVDEEALPMGVKAFVYAAFDLNQL
ncbi:M20 family metallopeptidase [Alicyclobacillus mengziensis]|uniref:Amidohydrolase n=1 Tax=Alicyclobacillus mengziensis TaxID=2931921 RepID=A0A9X7VWR0_9BACL|nr:M20 family metallopeptidase [Alicyclobacillus mengziensis]QSO46449.1 amidohydrolase [Alicyclobacillus mengziensis]